MTQLFKCLRGGAGNERGQAARHLPRSTPGNFSATSVSAVPSARLYLLQCVARSAAAEAEMIYLYCTRHRETSI